MLPIHRHPLTLALALCAAILVGCGGGSGSDNDGNNPPVDNANLNGTYAMAFLAASTAPNTARSEFGTLAFDGAGMVTPTIGENDFGTITPVAAMAPVAYSIAGDGTLTVPDETGQIAVDGRAAVTTRNTAMSSPGIRLMLELSGTYDNASLSGTFHFGGFFWTGEAVTHRTSTATGYYAFDGLGGITAPANVLQNANGGHSAIGPGSGATYTVNADGTVTMAPLLNVETLGGLSPDGTCAILAGATNAGFLPAIHVLIKTAAGANNATFSGTYIACGISSDPDSGGAVTSFSGIVTANGAGAMNYAMTVDNTEGTITMPSGPDDYSVAADGTLTSSSGYRVGAISADGRYAFLCGEGDDADGGTTEFPTFFFLVRR